MALFHTSFFDVMTHPSKDTPLKSVIKLSSFDIPPPPIIDDVINVQPTYSSNSYLVSLLVGYHCDQLALFEE